MKLRFAVMIGSLCLCGAVAACGASTTTPSAPAGTPTSSPTASAVATAAPTPVPTASPDFTPLDVPVVGTGAASPVAAVTDLASIDYDTGDRVSSDCTGSNFLVSPCPLTQRLAARLNAHPFSASGGGADPLCRCQGIPMTTFTLLSQNGATAYVHEGLGFVPSRDLRWKVVFVGASWYVDDQDTGCSATTIYSPAYDYYNAGGGATPDPPAPTC